MRFAFFTPILPHALLRRPVTAIAAVAFAVMLSAAPMEGSAPVTHARVFEVDTAVPDIDEAKLAARAAMRTDGVEAASALVRRWALAHTATMQALEPVAFAEPGIFRTLGARVVAGVPEEALSEGMLVVSQSLAKRFFGSGNALGQVIVLNGSSPMAIGAVIDDTAVEAAAGLHLFAGLEVLGTVERGTPDADLRAVTLIRMSDAAAPAAIEAVLTRANACACADSPAFLPATVKPLS